MQKVGTETQWELRPRSIYGDVLDKRNDDREVVATAALQKAEIDQDKICFESKEAQIRAISDGIFLLRVPGWVDLDCCDEFSQQFYKGEHTRPYGKFRNVSGKELGDDLLGFHERTNQIEQFLIEQRHWSEILPEEIKKCADDLTFISKLIIESFLGLTDIPEEYWAKATGGCSVQKGSYHFTFNHYRPEFPGLGLSSHKDDGFVTILRTRAKGLEINIHNRWEAVEPDENYFVINFGLAMEILTKKSSRPIAAIMHRVKHQSTDRHSFGHFSSSSCLPGKDAGIFSFSTINGLQRVCASRDLIDANDEEIYLGTLPEEER